MRIPSAALILALSLQAGAAVAATAPDRCAAEEQGLREKAKDACSGLSYLFNPSGCFIARKALDAFDVEECRAHAAPLRTAAEPPAPAPAPEQPPAPQPAARAAPPATTTAAPPHSGAEQEEAPPAATPPEPGLAELKAENARLKAENERLRAELEQLKGEEEGAGGTR